MKIFQKLFSRRMSVEQTEEYIDEIEQLAQLSHLFPAMVRLKMFGDKTDSSVAGPGGILHDRFVAATFALVARTAAMKGQRIEAVAAWQSLPNVLHASIDLIDGTVTPSADRILANIASDKSKEFVVLSNIVLNLRDRDPERQIRAYFELKDQPRCLAALLSFCGGFIVRSPLLNEHPSIFQSLKLDDFIPKLESAAQNDGTVVTYR
jgi:hypothetical protein